MKLSCSQRPSGIALVITLVLLSVIAFMAIAFLVLSRGEKSSVATVADQTTAKLASDTALERAKSELIAPMIAFRNAQLYDLTVSTNFINPHGFNNSLNGVNLTNVSYVDVNGNPLPVDQFNRSLANLYYSPRVPVFVKVDGTNDFRYYLDLNRNGRYDTNGHLPVMSGDPAFPYFDTNGVRVAQPFAGSTLSNHFVGDPEWIGQLERPGFPHSPSNRFVARYAYIAVPVGKTLDINAVHNYARQRSPAVMNTGDGFIRNQGVGPWEINLAAFLADLNTNLWFYETNSYRFQDLTLPNVGSAFDDALSVLRFRYNGNMAFNMPSVANLFGTAGANAFRTDFMDGYSAGPLMTLTWWPSPPDADLTRVQMVPWSGADNPQKFFTTQDLFDRAKFTINQNPPFVLSDRLRSAGLTNSSYDRYTFYRLLAQLGTDSTPDNPDVMNLNYDNLVTKVENPVTRVMERASTTNFIRWEDVDRLAAGPGQHTGLAFFTNAAARLFASSGFDTKVINYTNIQVWPTNLYTPSVHRLLQLAANMYDATTYRPAVLGTNQPPSVFRPILKYGVGGGDNVFIIGYEPVMRADVITSRLNLMRDLTLRSDRQAIGPNDLAYGVPLVIGAKKGWPNFNEFSGQTSIQVSRKLEFWRDPISGKVNETNQMYIVAVTNNFGLEAWNSYQNPVSADLELYAQGEVFGFMTNSSGNVVLDTVHRAFKTENINPSTWAGYTDENYARYSFRVPIDPKTNQVMLLTNSTYVNATRLLRPLTGVFERRSGFPNLDLLLNLRTRFKFVLVDRSLNRIIDYVSLDAVEDTLNIPEIISDGSIYPKTPTAKYTPNANPGSLWATNRSGANLNRPTFGVVNQILAGIGGIMISEQQWRNFIIEAPYSTKREDAQTEFRRRINSTDTSSGATRFFAPFTPVRTIYHNTIWQANDPLVHYTLGDLSLPRTNRLELDINVAQPFTNIRAVNGRYEPWTAEAASDSESPTRYDLTLKDPLITRSDDWDFPTNKLANIGWLGRVHRGTPWQTIYLKSPVLDSEVALRKWADWCGNSQELVNYGQVLRTLIETNKVYADAILARPDRDRELLDLFTTSFGETASRGKLSINQTNLAAWSAVLSGVVVLTNSVDDATIDNDSAPRPTNTWMVVHPAGVYDQTSAFTNWPAVARIVKGINDARATTNYGGTFRKLGDILAVPQLTVASPFINTNGFRLIRSIDDAAMERIPQQILGLLKVENSPRFVVYSYGQSLKPADRSVLVNGPLFGLCTNYQVTAEVAARAVVRVEGAPDKPKVVVESYNPLPPD